LKSAHFLGKRRNCVLRRRNDRATMPNGFRAPASDEQRLMAHGARSQTPGATPIGPTETPPVVYSQA
jgi:hypothetical protein